MDRSKQAPPAYEYQPFPAWYYGPDGQAEIFQSEDEVPEGWEDHPDKVGSADSGKTEFAAGNIDEDDEDVKALMDKNTHEELVEILEDAQKEDDSVEFLKSWPKLKLAQTIVHHGLQPEDLHDEE